MSCLKSAGGSGADFGMPSFSAPTFFCSLDTQLFIGQFCQAPPKQRSLDSLCKQAWRVSLTSSQRVSYIVSTLPTASS